MFSAVPRGQRSWQVLHAVDGDPMVLHIQRLHVWRSRHQTLAWQAHASEAAAQFQSERSRGVEPEHFLFLIPHGAVEIEAGTRLELRTK